MKIHSYIVAVLIAFFALIPPIIIIIPNPSFNTWVMMIVISGFLGFLTLFLNTNIFIKILSIGGFINCFFSCVPHECFTSYVSLLACCYFYILCSKVKNWNLIYKTVLCIVIYNLFFMTMQFFGKDSLLNFSMGKNIVEHGILGSRMELESFLLICLVILLAIKGSWKIMALMAVSLIIMLCIYKDSPTPILHNPLTSRIPVWLATIKLSNQHPFMGWGIGSYKFMFFPLSGLHTFPWKQAHNEFLQILFETGYAGLAVMLSIVGVLIYKLRKNITLLIGLGLICVDMSIHFPFRVANTVLILICFLAYCETKIKEA
jgi:hypothetical protein